MTGNAISSTRLYGIHAGMKSRCNNSQNQHYKWYGGKGIHVCDEWSGKGGAARFIEWALANGYEDGLSIDRIDPDKDYSPENCRWLSVSSNSSRTSKSGQYSEALLFIEKHKKDIAMVGSRGSAMEITLRDGTTVLFEKDDKQGGTRV